MNLDELCVVRLLIIVMCNILGERVSIGGGFFDFFLKFLTFLRLFGVPRCGFG